MWRLVLYLYNVVVVCTVLVEVTQLKENKTKRNIFKLPDVVCDANFM